MITLRGFAVLPIALTSIALTLSACATANPPTYTSGDVVTAAADVVAIAALPDMASVDMPTGTATYTGNIVGLEAGEGVIGDLTLNADFGASTISGSATNVNLVGSSEIGDQRLGGSLDVAGTIAGTGMTGTMTGALTGAVQGFAVTFDADLAMNGDFKTGSTPGDRVSGALTGAIDISSIAGSETLNLSTGTFGACVGGC